MSVPRSTYRLQLHAGFSFDAACNVIPYLRELGITHVYCSPYLQATPGSTHGYDVVDYHRVSAELGGEEARARFCAALGRAGLGQILDIVPNHMAIVGDYNAWWWDTLENGVASRYAPYFDIEWNGPEERLRNRILLPVLADHYGIVLAAGELVVERRGGSFRVRYGDQSFPVAPDTVSGMLFKAADRSGCERLGFLADALARLPATDTADWPTLVARHRNKEAIRKLLDGLCRKRPEVAAQIDSCVAEMNRDIDALDDLLSRQNYRLSRWRMAERELVYRRFFDINTLVGVRTEAEPVFRDSHQRVLEWLRKGELDGVRVDHPDGLSDPTGYFERIRKAAPDAWIVAEKILQPQERLPESWEIAGTTGYDFLNLAGGLFVDARGEAAINEFYREFTGEPVDFTAIAREKKAFVLRELLASDINRLTALFVQICEEHRDHRDYTRHEILQAVCEAIANFPVYRTYVRMAERPPYSGDPCVSEADAEYIAQSIQDAKTARPDIEERLFEFLRDVLLLRAHGPLEREFVRRFQQITAAAMAKGVEDTAFYSYVRMAALNEVGGNPGRFGVAVDAFHKWCCEAQARRPFAMLSTSTHDTKRSEDVRTRIGLLSEIPAAWAEAVRRWSAANSHYRNGFPDRKTEYLLYQTLVGAWPISQDRVLQYMRKAVREAKEQTSWITPNTAFEEALEKFIKSIVTDAAFQEDFEGFLSALVWPARIASLSLALLKLTAPGIPDTYQGTELWTLDLVDPDNRRPVGFEIRRRLLNELDDLTPEKMIERANEGLPKLWTIRQALRTRNAHPECFGAEGAYRPLWATGSKAQHVIAFQRGDGCITVAPRLPMTAGKWDATTLDMPPGLWRDQLSGDVIEGGRIEVGVLLTRFPIGLFTREGGK